MSFTWFATRGSFYQSSHNWVIWQPCLLATIQGWRRCCYFSSSRLLISKATNLLRDLAQKRFSFGRNSINLCNLLPISTIVVGCVNSRIIAWFQTAHSANFRICNLAIRLARGSCRISYLLEEPICAFLLLFLPSNNLQRRRCGSILAWKGKKGGWQKEREREFEDNGVHFHLPHFQFPSKVSQTEPFDLRHS
jgi:hypothetical protein